MAGYGSYQGAGGYESAYTRNVGGATSSQRRSAFDPSRHGYGSYVDGSADAFAASEREGRNVSGSRIGSEGLNPMGYLKDTAAVIRSMHDNARAWESHRESLETSRQARSESAAREARLAEDHEYNKTQRSVLERKSKAEADEAESKARRSKAQESYDANADARASKESEARIKQAEQAVAESIERVKLAVTEEERKNALHVYALKKEEANIRKLEQEVSLAKNAEERAQKKHELEVAKAALEQEQLTASKNLTIQQTSLLQKQIQEQELEVNRLVDAEARRKEQEDARLGAGTVLLLKEWVNSDQGRRTDSNAWDVQADKWLEQRGAKRKDGSKVEIRREAGSSQNGGVDKYAVHYIDEKGDANVFEIDNPDAMNALVKDYGLTQFKSAIPYDYEKQVEIQAKDRTNRGAAVGGEDSLKNLGKAVDMYNARIKDAESRLNNMKPSDPGYDKTKTEIEALYANKRQLEDLFIQTTSGVFGIGVDNGTVQNPEIKKPKPSQSGGASTTVYRPSGN